MKYLPLLFVLLVVGCSTDETGVDVDYSLEVINVNLKEVKPLKFSSFIDRIEYYYLESPENRPIGRVRKIIPFENKVGLFDAGRGSVWLYAMNGEYLNEVEIPTGRGPGELDEITDVIISEDGNIHALGTFKIVVYDLEGNFVNQIDFQFRVYRFTYFPETGEYLGYASNSMNPTLNNNHSGHNLILFDKEGEITRSFLPIGEGREQIGYGVPNKFPVHNGKTFFFAHLENEIYSVNPTEVKPVIELDFGEYTIPKNIFQKRSEYSPIPYDWQDFMNEEIYSNDYISFLSSVNISEHYIHLRYGSNSAHYNSIYNRETGEIMTGPSRMKNDIDNNVVPFFFATNDQALITVIESNDFLERMNEIYEESPEIYNGANMRELRHLAHGLSENRNPILQVSIFQSPDSIKKVTEKTR